METPPPETPVPLGPPDRRCPRCGAHLATDQEWCLNCGAAAGTEVVEARGWRVPLYLGGGGGLSLLGGGGGPCGGGGGVPRDPAARGTRNDGGAKNPPATPTPSAA